MPMWQITPFCVSSTVIHQQNNQDLGYDIKQGDQRQVQAALYWHLLPDIKIMKI